MNNLQPNPHEKFCPFCLAGETMDGKAQKQVVKIGTICPACGKKVE